MPRGDNPNSRANLTNRFNEKTARQAQQKSAESRKYNSSIREACRRAFDDDTLTEICQVLIKRAKAGNLAAIKLIFTMTDEPKAEPQQTEIRLAFLAQAGTPEEPPKYEPIPAEYFN